MLETLWPKDDAVRECLKVDAESADPAVLLAVHQPMRLQRRDFGAKSDPELCDEGRVLEALLAPTGTAGSSCQSWANSGVGKSHVIRWLDAQLQFAPGHKNRIVVRISKGQSLKGVLGRCSNSINCAAPAFSRSGNGSTALGTKCRGGRGEPALREPRLSA
jgi:hypothetical protein